MFETPPKTASQPTVAIETHGCKLNQSDSGRLALEFIAAGYRIVSSDLPSDVYVVNTCTVTHIADRKGRQALRAARRRNPEALIVASGCYAQRTPELLRQMEEVDLVVGNTDKSTLVDRVTSWGGIQVSPCTTGDDYEAVSPRALRTRAMVKIQEGCDQVCAYCIVPKVRGRERSIPAATIIDEINMYVQRGNKEAVLTGTQLGSYGFDLEDIALPRLIGRILAETEIERLRVSSLQPQEITTELLDLWADPRLCPHFHLPLQSGSDAILARMRRRYNSRQYRDSVDLIRKLIPAVSVTADVIAGFPGESEGDFAATLELCEQIEFAKLHVFPYSTRPGTSAAYLDNRIDPAVRSARAHTLLDLTKRHSLEFKIGMVGTVRPVLWEEQRDVDGTFVWSGLTDNYVRVFTKASGSFANRITDSKVLKIQEDLAWAEVLN